MASPSLARPAVRPQAFVCHVCRQQARVSRTARRPISQKFLRKTVDAELEWNKRSIEVKENQRKSVFQILEERGLINQTAGTREDLDRLMTEKRTGAYVGIDPTASSMHIGHILPFMVTFWMYLHGQKGISVIGGATAQIGDPTDRLKDREVMRPSVRKGNILCIQMQLKKIWKNVERLGETHGYHREWAWRRDICNNNTWLTKVSIVDFLKLLGRGARVGPMLGRDTVKNKMKSGDGMSYAEFTYPLLQGWDWWHLFSSKGAQIQVGGADQYGNIIAGIDAINFIAKNHHDPATVKQFSGPLMQPMGITVPLLTTSSGEKFGKSAGNAVWLDPNLTSSFELYQYFIRTADADVERYLKLLTFLPLPRIAEVMEQHRQDPSKRVAQHLLAKEFLLLAHGRPQAEQAEQQHKGIYGSQGVKKPVTPLPWQEGTDMNVKLPRSAVVGVPFPRVLVHAGLAKSASEGHRMITAQGAYAGARPTYPGEMGDDVTWTPIKTSDPLQTEKYILDGDRLMLRHGKWRVRIVHILSDEEFRRQGLEMPEVLKSERQIGRDINQARRANSGKPAKPKDDDLVQPRLSHWEPGRDERKQD